MRKRIRNVRLQLWLTKGVDIVVTHAAPTGLGDGEDPAHWGFDSLRELLDKYHPQYLLHGHVHLNYGMDPTRLRQYGDTAVINTSDRSELELPDREVQPRDVNRLIWRNGEPKLPEDTKPVGLFME